METCLADYLADHIARAQALCALTDQLASAAATADAGLQAFVASLRKEMHEDYETLERLATVFDATGMPVPARSTPQADALPALAVTPPAELFRTLETLALRILEKRSLWDALVLAAEWEPRLAYLDYPKLQARAIAQHYAIERRRLELTRAALIPC